jgi:histidine phosphotransferase ChpT
MHQTELAGIVCARICHDLVGPVGAVVNGTDLIADLGLANAEEEMALVAQSVRRAAAMLKFHRLAFGPAGDSASTLARGLLCERVSEVLAGPRVQFSCSAPEGPAISVAVARLLCLMTLAGRAMLGLSGSLKLVLPTSGAMPVAVIAQGDRTGATDDQRRWLAGAPGAAPESRLVEFALIGPAAAAVGARIELVEGAGQLALRAVSV